MFKQDMMILYTKDTGHDLLMSAYNVDLIENALSEVYYE